MELKAHITVGYPLCGPGCYRSEKVEHVVYKTVDACIQVYWGIDEESMVVPGDQRDAVPHRVVSATTVRPPETCWPYRRPIAVLHLLRLPLWHGALFEGETHGLSTIVLRSGSMHSEDT